MGFVSYFEDVEKLRDDLIHLARIIPDFSSTDILARQRALKGQVENITIYLNNLLDLATDPRIALADDLVTLRSEHTKLENQKTELSLRIENLAEEYNLLKSQLKEANRERIRADRALEKVAENDFSAALNAYPPKPGQVAKR